MNELELTGRAQTHVVQLMDPRYAAQPRAVDAFRAMQAAAAQEGLRIHPFSSFRGIRMQTRIWNKKFRGEKPLFDIHGIPRAQGSLDLDGRLRAILNWSALPGGSRHHWGTEIDVVDLAAVPPDYRVRLLPDEVAPGGPFHPLHQWLDENLERFGFFRPYARLQGGMYPEPWHLSFAELSVPALEALTQELLRDAIESQPMDGKVRTLELLPEFFKNHVRNVCPPESRILRSPVEG